jgi:hypothetical protein
VHWFFDWRRRPAASPASVRLLLRRSALHFLEAGIRTVSMGQMAAVMPCSMGGRHQISR